MSKGSKKPSKSHVEEVVPWDTGLVDEIIEDAIWKPFLLFLVPENTNVDVQLKALNNVIKGGNRKSFCCISKQDLLDTAQEDAKLVSSSSATGGKKSKQSKQGSAPVNPRPLHVQVCEHMVSAMASSGEPIPNSLLVRMIKYMIIKKRTRYLAEKEALSKIEVSDMDAKKGAGEKKKTSGRASKAGGKKGKDVPTESLPAVPVPSKLPTSMKKRGEEDYDSKYCNDEPEDGPSCYIVLTGFNTAEFYEEMESIKLTANSLTNVLDSKKHSRTQHHQKGKKIVIPDDSAEDEILSQFWPNIDGLVKSSNSESMLRNMARLTISVKSKTLPVEEEERIAYSQEMFDRIALKSYQLFEEYTDYQHYLDYLHLQALPSCTGEIRAAANDDNMRCYNEILKPISKKNTTIPLIVHAMVEQVSVTVDASTPSVNNIQTYPAASEISKLMEHLSLSKQDKEYLGIETDKGRSEDMSRKAILTQGDEIARRNIHNNLEEKAIQLAAQNAFTNLCCYANPDMRGSIHALNHLLHNSGSLSLIHFNHTLIALSLENVILRTASTPPEYSFKNPQISTLLYDHPFDLEIESMDNRIVPFSDASSSAVLSNPNEPTTYTLRVAPSCRDLESHYVLEALEVPGMLQEIISLQDTHPYLEIFEHKHSESIILIVHAGFDGSPMHTYKTSSHTHTKVGFQNYLLYVADKYNHLVEKAIEEDEVLEREFEAERKITIAQRLKEMEEKHLHQEALPTVTEGKVQDSSKGKKKVEAASKAKKKTVAEIAPTSTTEEDLQAIEASLPHFKKSNRFTGYDLGDTVLLKETLHTTLFTADGVKIEGKKHSALEDPPYSEVSLLHNGHRVTCNIAWLPKATKTVETGLQSEEEMFIANSPPFARIPQLPKDLKHASLHAHFTHSLHISCSHYGPKGNGKVPFLPHRPPILSLPLKVESSHGSRPGSQQSTSPKLSKKQQEHQNQIMEQQRLLEVQQERERKLALEKYQEDYKNLLRQNKYQVLYITTEFGLEVKSQPTIHLDADPNIVDGSDGFIIIKQSYSHPEATPDLSESISKERCRYYHPNGFVIRCMRDGSRVILNADGTTYRTASHKEIETYNKRRSSFHKRSKKALTIKVELDRPDKEHDSSIISSANAVTFSDDPMQSRSFRKSIWMVTTPAGDRYFLQQEEEVKKVAEHLCTDSSTESSESTGVDKIQNFSEETKWKNTVIPFESIHLLKSIDPVTKEVYITREDGVVLVHCPDNSYITEFEDGTRITVSVTDGDPKSPVIITECNGFSRVTYGIDAHQCLLDFPDGSVVACSSTGAYTVRKEGDYELNINSSGEAVYKIPNASYSLNHTKKNKVFSCEDSQGNTFSMQSSGETKINSASSVHHKAFDPRYFIINADKSAFELHNSSAMKEVMLHAKSDPNIAILEDSVLNERGIHAVTVIEPVTCTPPSLPYNNESIVPHNLKSEPPPPKGTAIVKNKPKFGSLVGKGLAIGSFQKPAPLPAYTPPPALKYRQFLRLSSLKDTRKQVHEVVASYINQRTNRILKSESMQPTEHREQSEIELANGLQMKFMESVARDVSGSYNNSMLSQREVCIEYSPPSISSEGLDFIKNSKSELQAASDIRKALLNRVIPPYFKSDQGSSYVPAKSPDMVFLTTKLAQPSEGHSRSHSTFQSSSLHLNLDESDSLTLSVLDPVNSTLRPSHPTPNHALGGKTPTELYSSNPVTSQSISNNILSLSVPTAPHATVSDKGLSSKHSSLFLDVTGQPRSKSVPIPASLIGARPGELPNIKYSTIEEPVKRKVVTSSSVGSSKMRGFEVMQEEIDFGVLKEGTTYSYVFHLKNAGMDISHFKIKQPPPSTGIRVKYSPGFVPAGLSRAITVELFAMAVGTVGEHGSGLIYHELEIVTEPNILHVPIKANVLTVSLYNEHQPPYSLVHGVQVIGDARQSVTHPIKRKCN